MLGKEINGSEPRYTKNGKCLTCGRYALLNEWRTCKRCDNASKKKKRAGYLRLPHEQEKI